MITNKDQELRTYKDLKNYPNLEVIEPDLLLEATEKVFNGIKVNKKSYIQNGKKISFLHFIKIQLKV